MTLQAEALSYLWDSRTLIAWARDHRWLSADTIQRRLHIDRGKAERIIQGLILAGALHPQPENTVYRVRYPRRNRREPWICKCD